MTGKDDTEKDSQLRLERQSRFELYIAKMKLANAYTELNDPAVQEENFQIQLRWQE